MSNHDVQRAMALQQSGDAAGAAKIYRRLMQSVPANAQLLFLLGTAEMQLGNFEEAVSLFRKSLRLVPSQFRALSNLAVAQKELGRLDDAVTNLDRAIAINPGYAMAHNNRGAVLLQLGRQDEALASFERAIAIEPRYADAHRNRGNILRERGELEEALPAVERALALDSNNALSHCSRGIILNELCRPALASFDRAIALDPRMANAHCGRATALFSLKQLDEARASNERALAVEPDHAEALWNSARFALITGDFAAGWELQEGRWKLHEVRASLPSFMAADSGRKLWTGNEAISGKTLLVHAEQGFGDFVQFCRYLPMLRAGKVVVQAKARLLPLLRTLEGEYDFIDTTSPLPDFDFYCPIMSLPRAFGTRLETIPTKVPYLFAAPEKQERVAARLGEKAAPRIGLVWSGNPGHKTDRLRSIPLKLLAPLLQAPFEFHCLQKEISPADVALMDASHIRRHDDVQDDFSDAAALIACMDLVITVDTAVAHIAGAMGKPVWILLPFMADWRWLLDRADSPWYPTATLLRQSAPGDWQSVIEAVCARLGRLLG